MDISRFAAPAGACTTRCHHRQSRPLRPSATPCRRLRNREAARRVRERRASQLANAQEQVCGEGQGVGPALCASLGPWFTHRLARHGRYARQAGAHTCP